MDYLTAPRLKCFGVRHRLMSYHPESFLKVPDKFKLSLLIAAAVSYSTLNSLHELGHWGAAMCASFHAPTFRIGRGKPELPLFKIMDTNFVLCPLPIGGSVEVSELKADCSEHDSNEAKLKEIAVLLAGPIVNLALAFLLALSITAEGAKLQVAKSISLCTKQVAEIFELMAASLALRRQTCSNNGFVYYRFFEIPFVAATSARAMISVLFSVSLGEAIINLLPIPIVDGGKVCILVLSFCGVYITYEIQILTSVVTSLIIVITFFTAMYRDLRWPVPNHHTI